MKILLSLIIYYLSFTAIFTFDCLWSTYRPGPYFGLRSTTRDSPLFGLMWYYPEKMNSVKSMRHFMEISDSIHKYEWKAHNGCDYGQLKIEDPIMNVNFEISFYNEYSNENGNHWVVSISGVTNNTADKGIVIMWYISNSSNSSNSSDTIDGASQLGLNYDPITSTLLGNSNTSTDNRNFYVKSVNLNNKHPEYKGIKYDSEYYLVLDISEDKLYDPSEYIIGELKDTVGNTPNHLTDSSDSYRSAGVLQGNVFIQQIFLIGEFRLDIHFFDNQILENKLDQLLVTNMLISKAKEFEDNFSNIFLQSYSLTNPSQRMNKFITANLEIKDIDAKLTAVSALSTLFSNMLYMNGNLHILDICKDKDKGKVILSKPMDLLTIGPDKTSHSRGFMWDEGFQQRVLSLWNLELSLKIVSNWFNNVDEVTGWLAREQSLDNESRSRAPPSSWASIPDVSNPPSLYLFIDTLFDRDVSKSVLREFLLPIIENIELNAKWYLRTQQGSTQFIFSWKGKTDDFCLPSGLDDYPRCRLNGKSFTEGHLDLQSWIIAMAKTMVRIYSFLGEKYNNRITNWSEIYHKAYDNLIKYFWNEEKNVFDDFYINEDNIKVFSNHTGYIQLFPLILDVLNENLEGNKLYINSSLDLILNPEHGLRTNFGIRSLSTNDPDYKKGQNYWTSPIWININYLIIKSLNRLKSVAVYSYLKEDYEEIRLSVVNNMVRNFEVNGFIWEVYDDINGDGKYNHPFTGWSALIVNLIYEMF